MTWQIQLPYRTKSAPVVEIAECARTLDDKEERAVTRQLALLLAVEHDCTSVQDALDLVGKAAPEERRRLLDAARTRAGLPSIGDLEEDERVAAAQRAALARRRDPRPTRLALSDVGGIIDLSWVDDEIARERAREESRRRGRGEAG